MEKIENDGQRTSGRGLYIRKVMTNITLILPQPMMRTRHDSHSSTVSLQVL